MNEIKPSEALFVRTLLPHCKRIGALWLQSTKTNREKFKEHKIKGMSNGNIKIKERFKNIRNKDEEVFAMVTVLRKIYKEVHPPSTINLIRSWLSLSNDDNTCVLTRGDTKGRMRRIDGGKGPDKVWRLDTLIGMLYHGLPLTSSDSSLIYHTCKHELCIRPQHLRVKLSSFAVVLVLKTLSQAGYSIKKNDSVVERLDEFVDISGPFTIEKLDTLRHEFVKVDEIKNFKLASSPDDYFILEQNPSLKKYYKVQSKEIRSPTPNMDIKQASAIYKRQLLFRLIGNTKKEKQMFQSQNDVDPHVNIPAIIQPLTTIPTEAVQATPIPNPERLSNGIELSKLNYSKEKRSTGDTVCQSMEVEETELIEIMNSKPVRRKTDWMDSMLSEIEHSPSKSVLDRLIKDIIRTGSGSDKESRDSKFWNGIKSEVDDSNYELFDLLNNMRPCSRSEISIKMTPNIFSPISDTEELLLAAE